MTTADIGQAPRAAASQALFAATIFASAALVFLVEPMAAKLVLPLLGGGPSVWNTSLAFFQAALLAGYAYANLLQRLGSLRAQVLTHLGVLAASALVLPLRVHEAFGPPSSDHPALWLLGVLAVSLGPPFAALSATAPLVQVWYARVMRLDEGRGPYSLYAASNLGSLIALLAYPVVVEPAASLHGQRIAWSAGYGLFILLLATLGFSAARTRDLSPAPARAAGPSVAWRDRLTWLALAAIPSSLMLGVTTHLTTDVASAPFLWVAPLALYLLTFIIAFQDKPLIKPGLALTLQAAAAAAAAVTLPFKAGGFVLTLGVQLLGFFLTALMCHQALVARRPDPSRLTAFYLWMSVGGVVGGAFNAFAAPVIFNNVWEYPLVLALSCLARPWGRGRFAVWRWGVLAAAIGAAMAAPMLAERHQPETVVKLALATVTVCAFLLRGRAVMFLAAIVLVLVSATTINGRVDVRETWRSFFGVVRQSERPVAAMGGPVRMLSHGSTLHGAQALDPRWRCRPLTYYAPETPIGQVFTSALERKPALRIGAVGLGTGTVSAYTRPTDTLTFFEIDPLVVRIATDPRHFSYTTGCAKGRIDYVVGDARLTVGRQAKDRFDILLIDAFSSDSVPAHLLTVEAVKSYLERVMPDGIVILHLSNRNLDLRSPAMAVARAAGGVALLQRHMEAPGAPPLWESSEDALIVGRDAAALAPFAGNPRWTPADPTRAKPWTDDYMNLAGALYARQKERLTWLP
ncbi:fused MFS/spermidine synthase [Phenylobacterium sp.]|jgi:SAM-dependent methyltransferase|uniref:spermidine synthase n=1 Tax=Phenylobacterium sp. TaxID=1871053 RepID=UPI002F400E5B